MIRVTEILQAGTWDQAPVDHITLDREDRHRRRAVMSGEGGTEFLLDEPDATASAGIYLFSLTFDTSGADASAPLYFVAGYGLPEPALDEAIEEAEEWVEANLVPEPASLMLVSLGLAAVARRRR